MTTYLKFEDEAECLAVFGPSLISDETGEHMPAYIGPCAVDVVGVIHRPTGAVLTDTEGTEYAEMAPIPGWHVNLSDGPVPEALEPYVISAPTTPARVFAGD